MKARYFSMLSNSIWTLGILLFLPLNCSSPRDRQTLLYDEIAKTGAEVHVHENGVYVLYGAAILTYSDDGLIQKIKSQNRGVIVPDMQTLSKLQSVHDLKYVSFVGIPVPENLREYLRSILAPNVKIDFESQFIE